MAPQSSKPRSTSGSNAASSPSINPKSKSKMSMIVSTPAPVSFKGKSKVTLQDRADSSNEEDSDNDNISLEGDDSDTEDEIKAAKNAPGKSKKTAKRKRRATSPTSFGLALESLLGTAPAQQSGSEESDEDVSTGETEERNADLDEEKDVEQEPKPKKLKATAASVAHGSTILSLAPHLRRSAQSTKLNARASRIAIEQRRAREERAHVTDLIAGWGPPGQPAQVEDSESSKVKPEQETQDMLLSEWLNQGGNQGYERRLRKVAQRGVVKLFNAIRAAQSTTADELQEAESKHGTGTSRKASTEAKKPVTVLAGKDKRLADLSKNNFLDMIRKGTSGGTKAKTSSITAK